MLHRRRQEAHVPSIVFSCPAEALPNRGGNANISPVHRIWHPRLREDPATPPREGSPTTAPPTMAPAMMGRDRLGTFASHVCRPRRAAAATASEEAGRRRRKRGLATGAPRPVPESSDRTSDLASETSAVAAFSASSRGTAGTRSANATKIRVAMKSAAPSRARSTRRRPSETLCRPAAARDRAMTAETPKDPEDRGEAVRQSFAAGRMTTTSRASQPPAEPQNDWDHRVPTSGGEEPCLHRDLRGEGGHERRGRRSRSRTGPPRPARHAAQPRAAPRSTGSCRPYPIAIHGASAPAVSNGLSACRGLVPANPARDDGNRFDDQGHDQREGDPVDRRAGEPPIGQIPVPEEQRVGDRTQEGGARQQLEDSPIAIALPACAVRTRPAWRWRPGR